MEPATPKKTASRKPTKVASGQDPAPGHAPDTKVYDAPQDTPEGISKDKSRDEKLEIDQSVLSRSVKEVDLHHAIRIPGKLKATRLVFRGEPKLVYQRSPFILTDAMLDMDEPDLRKKIEEVCILGSLACVTAEAKAEILKPRGKRYIASDLKLFDAFKRDPLQQNPANIATFAAAPIAMHRKITSGLDPMDQQILDMHEAGKTDSEIRALVCEQFGTMYTVKSLGARYNRITQKCAAENAKLLARGKKEWTSEMDEVALLGRQYIHDWIHDETQKLERRRPKELARFFHERTNTWIDGRAIDARASELLGMPEPDSNRESSPKRTEAWKRPRSPSPEEKVSPKKSKK